MQHPPLDRLPATVLQDTEEQVSAWLLAFGESLAQEGAPFGHVVLVVDGGLRLSGRDALGQEFTLRRVGPGQWWGASSALEGIAAASCRTSADTKMLAVPLELWQHWCSTQPQIADWLVQHP